MASSAYPERRLRIMLRHPSIQGIVQKKISQQGANDTTLWSALVTWDQLAVFLLHWHLQPALNVENHPFLLRVFLYRPHQQIAWDVIEETPDVQVNDPVMPPTSLACSPHRIQGRLPRAIPERIRMEQWVHHRLQSRLHHRLCDQIGRASCRESWNVS